MINCLEISLSLINSSKVIMIFSLSKKTVFIFGEAFIIIGGKVSFRPPVGIDFLAHWVRETKIKKDKKHFPDLFIPIYYADKIKQYSQDNLLDNQYNIMAFVNSLQ